MYYLLLLGLFLVSACAPTFQERLEANQPTFEAAIGQCNSEYGELKRDNALKRVDCVHSAFSLMMQQSEYPYPDLVHELGIVRKGLAIQYKEGKISKEEYENSVQLAMLNMDRIGMARDEEKRRQSAAAWAAFSQQMQQQQYQQQIINNMNRPVTTNCSAFGNSVNCTSW